MKKGLLFLFLIIGVHAIAQRSLNRTNACLFTPAFTYSPSTPCANTSVTFTNTSQNNTISDFGTSTSYFPRSYTGLNLTSNVGQAIIFRVYVYGGNTRNYSISTFTVTGSSSAGVVTAAWPLTANANPSALTGAGAATVTAQAQTLGATTLLNGYSGGNALSTRPSTSPWPSSVDNNAYIQFSVTPNATYSYTVSGISFSEKQTGGGGTMKRILMYSTDGGTTFSVVPGSGGAASGLTYTWDFGDASATTGTTSPSHSYTSTGLYTVTLSAYDGSCTSMATQTIGVTGPVVYVNHAAVGANNGTSWANAFTSLQTGIDAAAICGSQVWVAHGTYKPNSYPWGAGTTARDYAYALKNNVAIYGGFVGTETLLTQRNYITNLTTLSGDIGTVGVNTDNCHHVVVGFNNNNSAVLDGFVITKGYANVASSLTLSGSDIIRREDGGGMINRNASPTIANCYFTSNTATDEGGAIYNFNSSPAITNCSFTSNTAIYGGAMGNYGALPTILNSSFLLNTATSHGGGIYNTNSSSPSISNSTFTSNVGNRGGAIYTTASSTCTVANCSFASNTVPSEGGAIYNNSSLSSAISGSSFQTNSADDGGAIYNNASPTQITTCTFTGNTAIGDGGAIRNAGSSSAIIDSCTFTNDTAQLGGGIQNSNSSPTISNCTFRTNHAIDRGGGITNSGGSPIITGCLFESNSSDDGAGGLLNNNSSTANITKCIFLNNTATVTGGGLRNESCASTITNCIFIGNSSANGGGIYNNNNTNVATFTNCTIYANNASSTGGGIRNNSSNAIFKNCIIWGNAGAGVQSISNTGATPVVTYSTVQGAYTGTGNINTDPLFVNTSNLKGTDNTWATADDGLMINCQSPAKNAGTATEAPSTDIVGSSRVNPDMGAYEQVAPPIVPSASIGITTGSQSICSGTSVTFTATPTNCGSSPTYQWQVNGGSVGTNAATYTNAALANGDLVKCIVTPGLDICPSTAAATSNEITMTVNGATTSIINLVVCSNNLPYTWNGNDYSLGGTYVFNTTNAAGCDSTATLDLTIKQPTTSTINIANCVSYVWNGTTYTSSGTYVFNTTNAAGCDSTATLDLTVKQPTTSTTTISNCVSYVWNGTTYTASGIYVFNTTNAAGCDSIATLNLTIKQPTISTTNISNCVSYVWNGTTYTSSGTYVFNTTNAAGCDSTATLNLTIKQPTTSTTIISNCVSYVWNGTTYTASGIYVFNTTNAAGCDSTATLNLTIKQPSSSLTTVSNCVSYTWNGTTYTSSGTYVWNGTNAAGCDSTATLDLTIKQPTTSTTTISNCVSYTWNGTTYSSSGTYVFNTTNAAGCDSTATLNLTIKQPTTSTTIISNCVSYVWNGTTYTSSGTYVWNGTNAAGCDSTATLDLTIKQPTTSTTTISNCVNYTWNGTTYTSSGTYVWNGTNAAGCDSTATLNLTIKQPTTSTTTVSNCVNYTWNGTTYTSSGTYTFNTTNAAGCDSTATLSLTITTAITPSVSISASTNNICAGTSITFTASPTNGGTAPTYQWKVNGSNVGTNSASFSSSNLNNGNIVSCVLTSNATCLITGSANSNSIIITVTSSVVSAVNIVASDNNICSGINVTFTATPTNGGSSPTYVWQINGVSAGTSSTFTSPSLINADIVTCVLTSNAACLTTADATSNSITMLVNPNLTPAITIAANATTICAGASVTFTATATHGGTTAAYQWKINGTNTGTNSPTFTSATLSNSDIVTCVLTSSATCVTSATATSNSITIAVNPILIPSVSIAASATTVCTGTSVTFTATPINGGTAASYQWKINGTNVGTNSPSFTTSSLSNNDVVTCVLTSNATCLSTTTASSNGITMAVNGNLTPSVSITASAGTICAGRLVTFTATVTNGGASPVYQWKINGVNVGTNSSTFASSTLANVDFVTCTITSNAACLTTSTAASNNIVMVVNPNLTPTIAIASSATTICGGTNVTFTATATNGGTMPSYQWKVNGTNTGTNSTTFSSTTLSNTDVVTCVLTSSATCVTSATATSNSIAMVVNPILTPSVSIAASATTICAGASLTFTATPTNGGTIPSYQWKVNGTNAGTNSPIFTSSTLNNNDVVTCVLTSNASCLSAAASATSNSITIIVNASVTPSISIGSSANNICSGTSVTFTATATNGGTSPTYQWKVNAVNAGTNASTFTSTSLNNGDIVTCFLTSNATCLATTSSTSSGITMVINPNLTPTISIVASTNNVCVGTSITFTATQTNGGTAPTYQWKVNGTNVGTNTSTFTSTTLNNAEIVTCVLTSNATCLATPTATSNSITISASTPVTPSVSIAASATNICSGISVLFTAVATNEGTTPTYQWTINGLNVGTNTSTFTSTTLSNNDVVTCVLVSSAACTSSSTATSNSITMVVTTAVTPTISIASSVPSICAGTAASFTANITNGGSSPNYQWQINGANAGTNSNTFVATALQPNDAVTCILTSNATCVASSTVSSNTAAIVVHALPTVFAGPDRTIFTGGFTQLFATAFGNIDSIKWTPSTSLSYDTILQPIAKPIATTLYRLRVVTVDGCSATDDVEIKVVDGVFVPNAFSPNGDNINDKWEIPALADFPESFVQVFNRAGQLVFKATSYTNTKYWDGKKNGSPLPVGVYYYIIDLKNGNKLMSGYVTILK